MSGSLWEIVNGEVWASSCRLEWSRPQVRAGRQALKLTRLKSHVGGQQPERSGGVYAVGSPGGCCPGFEIRSSCSEKATPRKLTQQRPDQGVTGSVGPRKLDKKPCKTLFHIVHLCYNRDR